MSCDRCDMPDHCEECCFVAQGDFCVHCESVFNGIRRTNSGITWYTPADVREYLASDDYCLAALPVLRSAFLQRPRPMRKPRNFDRERWRFILRRWGDRLPAEIRPPVALTIGCLRVLADWENGRLVGHELSVATADVEYGLLPREAQADWAEERGFRSLAIFLRND